MSPRASSSSSVCAAGELGPRGLAAGQLELDPDLEAEVDDPRDHRLDRVVRSASSETVTSCGRTSLPSIRLTGPTKPITKSFAGWS